MHSPRARLAWTCKKIRRKSQVSYPARACASERANGAELNSARSALDVEPFDPFLFVFFVVLVVVCVCVPSIMQLTAVTEEAKKKEEENAARGDEREMDTRVAGICYAGDFLRERLTIRIGDHYPDLCAAATAARETVFLWENAGRKF